MININDPVEVLLTRKGAHVLNDWEHTISQQFNHVPVRHKPNTWYPTTYWVVQKIFAHHFQLNHEPPYTTIRVIPKSNPTTIQPQELVAN